ncbi:hypothetical protein HMPREF1531_02486 [Propionibacterium sp. oral taxon 192 str. F0372]|nr:hypothetical protein HMPREF1531_02486 [Propionibacterium sp. oral taxon 192 str. F0372]
MSFLATGVGALAVYDDAHPESLTWVSIAREHVDLIVAG